MDDWVIATDLQKLELGKLQLKHLLFPHNGHSVFFPRLFILGLSFLTRWNILYQLYGSWIFSALTWLILWSLLKLTLKDLQSYVKPLAVAHSFLLFSLCQSENFLWGWQIGWYFAAFFAVVSIWSLSFWRGRWIGIIVSAATALITTFSMASGILLWGVLFLVILDRRNWKIQHIYFWLAFSVCSIVAYFLNLLNYPQEYLVPRKSFLFLKFFFITIGAPFGAIGPRQQVLLSVFAGLISVVAFVVPFRWIRANNSELFSKCRPWAALTLYGFLSLILVTVARTKYGLGGAFITRYTMFSMLFWCGAIVPISLFVFENRKSTSWKMIALIVGILFVFGYSATAIRRYTRITEYSKRFEIGKRALYDYQAAQETDLRLICNSSVDWIRRSAAHLESRRLGPFVEGTGAKYFKRMLSEWDQIARDLKLRPVPVQARSIHVKKENASELSAETLKILCTSKRGISFDVKWNDVPVWNQAKPCPILLIHSRKANHLRIESEQFNRMRVSHYYNLPLPDQWKVFHVLAPTDKGKLSFHLEYSATPPFEDQLKVTCLAP